MRRRPLLLGLLALLGLTLVAGAAMPAGAGPKPPPVPDAIRPPAGQQVVLDVAGKGVQIYDCRPSATDPNVSAWTFREPAATLSGHGRSPVGIHFRGPTFELFDGSSVTGTVKGSVTVSGAVPWLLLEATANQGDGGLAGGSRRSTSCSGSRPGAELRRPGRATRPMTRPWPSPTGRAMSSTPTDAPAIG
jgi:hypothetical protein